MSQSSKKTQNLFSRKNFADLAKEALAKMWDYAEKGFFCDVILTAAKDNKKITAHGAVLSTMSKFFEKRFSGDFRKPNEEKEVLISDVSGDILESLVKFCYTGIIDVNEDNAMVILPQAYLLLFDDVVEACSAVLIPTINTENCLSIAKWAKLYKCQDLLESAEDYLKEHFEKVTATNQFLQLSQEELEKYLSLDDLDVENEKQVFEAAMKWLNHDLENRSSALSKLLPLIRTQHIDYIYLLEYVANNSCNISSLWDEIKHRRSNAHLNAIPARTWTKGIRIVFVCTKKIQMYNPKRSVIKFSYDIPVDDDFKTTLLEEKLILVGEDGKVRCFDLNIKTWHELTSTLTERKRNSVEVLNECVYVVGGYTNRTTTNTVDRWDSKLNSWRRVKEMNYARLDHCSAIVNGKLYAIGGYANLADLNSVECYDPITDSWSVCSPLLTARIDARAVAVNQEIFVFGGFNNNSGTLNCIEKYNPETNTWTKVGQMSYKRHSMGAYLFNKKIYLFGGENEKHEWQKSMEEFDPLTNECKLIDAPNIDYTETLYCFPYSSKNKK